MKAFTFYITFVLFFLGHAWLQAQDFLLRGCYESCQDSAATGDWIKKIQEQAPDLAFRGFTCIWLPKAKPSEKKQFSELVNVLRQSGIQPMMDLGIPNGEVVFQLMPLSEQLRNDFLIKSFRIHSKETPKPILIANFLKEYYKQNPTPEFVFSDIQTLETPQKLANWVHEVLQNLPEELRPTILPRVYDYPLREALRRASTDAEFDAREIYTSSVRDATALIGYNVVTGINSDHFTPAVDKQKEQNSWLEDPLLAYAYLLTNNQIGIPEIYYADYFGKESGNKLYADKQPLKKEIDQLLKVHREFIVESTEIEYLNRTDTDKQSIYANAVDGANATRALIFQLDGTNTPAGKTNKGRRDVLVAINFAAVPLKVMHQINMSNVRPGDIFTDILGRSAEAAGKVQDFEDLNIKNAIYIELPPRSYSIWVQGEAPPVALGTLHLSVEAFDDFVELAWETPMETNISGYELERSVNGSPFKKIAELSALGEAGANYLYTDEERLREEEVAYRVKILHNKGEADYSSVREIKPSVKALTFELLDSNTSGIKTIKIKSNELDEGKVTVFNAAGKSVVAFSHSIKKGVSLAQIDLTTLPKGIYLLNIEAKNKVWSKKIINK